MPRDKGARMIDDTDMVESSESASLGSPEETTPEPQVNQQAVEKKAEELYQARNFKMLREQAEQNARRAEQAEREAYMLKMKYEQQSSPRAKIRDLGDDDIAEGKDLAAQRAYVDEKHKQQQDEISELKNMLTEYHIRTQCPDFDSVVTSENLQKLAQEYPEVAATINSSADTKSKAISAYKLIKKLDINNPQSQIDRELVAKNLNKPKPSNALPKSESDLTRVNAFEKGLTDSEKEARYKQMRAAASQYSPNQG